MAKTLPLIAMDDGMQKNFQNWTVVSPEFSFELLKL